MATAPTRQARGRRRPWRSSRRHRPGHRLPRIDALDRAAVGSERTDSPRGSRADVATRDHRPRRGPPALVGWKLTAILDQRGEERTLRPVTALGETLLAASVAAAAGEHRSVRRRRSRPCVLGHEDTRELIRVGASCLQDSPRRPRPASLSSGRVPVGRPRGHCVPQTSLREKPGRRTLHSRSSPRTPRTPSANTAG